MNLLIVEVDLEHAQTQTLGGVTVDLDAFAVFAMVTASALAALARPDPQFKRLGVLALVRCQIARHEAFELRALELCGDQRADVEAGRSEDGRVEGCGAGEEL